MIYEFRGFVMIVIEVVGVDGNCTLPFCIYDLIL